MAAAAPSTSKSSGSSSTNRNKLNESPSDKSLVSKLKEEYLKPVTTDNILFHYLPLHGAISYSALSVSVMNPSFLSKCWPKKDITNILLFGSMGGIALYIYDRSHMHHLEKGPHAGYSVFGSVMFTFGSVLVWAIMRSVLPENLFVCSLCGLLSAAGFMKCGSSYCAAVDDQIMPKSEHE